jgi:hypothetical protein
MNDKQLKKEKIDVVVIPLIVLDDIIILLKIRSDYPNIYFRRLGKIEILKQLEEFENE